MPAPRKYPDELRERAKRLVREAREQEPELSLNAAVKRIGPRVGINADTLRGWCKQADIDDGRTPGDDHGRRRAAQGTRAGGPRAQAGQRDPAGGVEFLRARARPATALVVAFIADHEDRFGVEPICRVLTEHGVTIAPTTFHAARSRPPSARALRDAEVLVEVKRVHSDRKLGRGFYGARKVWHQLRREGGVNGQEVPRCQVERLMRAEGLHGVRRGKQFVTTKPDAAAARPPDLVNRDFTAEAPNRLWLVDFTYVPTWAGMAFTAFVQYTGIRYSDGLLDAGAVASIGTVGDYDNAAAETVMGLFKNEAVAAGSPFRDGRLRTLADVERVTTDYVHWYNHQRLHGELGHVPPEEYEQAYNAAPPDPPPGESSHRKMA